MKILYIIIITTKPMSSRNEFPNDSDRSGLSHFQTLMLLRAGRRGDKVKFILLHSSHDHGHGLDTSF